MVGSLIEGRYDKKLGLDSDVFFFLLPFLLTRPRLDSRVRVLTILYAAGFEKVLSFLGYKEQDLGIQGGLCSKVEDEVDSCSQSASHWPSSDQTD